MPHHRLMFTDKLHFELFAISFLVSIIMTWYTMIVKKDFIYFTDPETVPEPTEVIPSLLGISDVSEE